MFRNISLLFLLVCVGCNPYLTKRINLLSKKDRGDSIYVVYPIVEAKRQSNAAIFKDPENEAYQIADSLTKKVLHQQLDGRLPVWFAGFDSGTYVKTKKLLDSVLAKFMKSNVKHFRLGEGFVFPTKMNLILIPYYIWTRSTEDYDRGKCSRGGYRTYGGYEYCTWTTSQTYLFILNRKKNQIVFFKFNGWAISTIYLPYDYRVTRNFRHCIEPLLRKLGE